MQSSGKVIILLEKIVLARVGGVAVYFRDHLNIKERIELWPDHCKADISNNVMSTVEHSLSNFIQK